MLDNLKRTVKPILNEIPFALPAKRRLWDLIFGKDGLNGSTRLNMLREFALFSPNSAGRYGDKAALTRQSIKQTIPFMSSLAMSVRRARLEVVDIRSFSTADADRQAALDLKHCLDEHSSDKADRHNYHHLYGPILKDRASIERIFEIGLGTNNTDVVSNMGFAGKPGASLRAFRDFLDRAHIYGADVDKRVLFKEDRIDTFFVDQTDPSSFDRLGARIPEEFDLLIDDGLHSPDANIASLNFGLRKVKRGGWVVIEDIAAEAIPVWEVVAAILPEGYRSHLFAADGGMVYAVQSPDH